ncbi:MAG: dephospho-CoA kinase [Pseudomonadota bacterium]
MIILGLTGSIGMGKSTTASFFKELGIPVHDADATVHDLYEHEAVTPVGNRFPQAVVDGKIDRKILASAVLGDDDAIAELEAIVHPLVRNREQAFLQKAKKEGELIVVLDIPLLFETGADQRVDKILVVTAPADVQRERVMSRAGMTEKRFNAILKKQMPDAQKREGADFLIDTSLGFDDARQSVRDIVAQLAKRNQNR